jgi:hypothetical protein
MTGEIARLRSYCTFDARAGGHLADRPGRRASDLAQDLWGRVGVALSRERRLVEPIVLFPGGLAGLLVPFAACLAALVARRRLWIGRTRRP